MNPTLRSFLINSGKHAVNALLTNATLMTLFGEWAQLDTRTEWWHILQVAFGCVVAREATVWLPRLLLWSQSTNGGEPPKAKGAAA